MTEKESGSRTRTRQAIIDAAIEVLVQNKTASLGDIATAAGVGRTTLHRYFAERSDLLSAVSVEGGARVDRATGRAQVSEGTGLAALLRLCQEYYELGGLLMLIFDDPHMVSDPAWSGNTDCDPRIHALVERGCQDGTLDPSLPVPWVQSLLWSQLYAAWSYTAETGAARHETMELLLRTLGKAVSPPCR